MVAVGGHAVADELGVDLGSARQGVLTLLEDQGRRSLAHHEAVAVGVERAGEALAGSSLRVESARAWLKPATANSQIGASPPPATITSASPRLMISAASPMALAEAAQAVTVQMFGP